MKSTHAATVGRKLWVWVNFVEGILDANQALDGTVKYVHPDGTVNVEVTTHTGAKHFFEKLEVHDPSDNPNSPNHHNVTMESPYATWMPYQKSQMDVAGKMAPAGPLPPGATNTEGTKK
jgi:hypothetical protein